MDTGWEEVYAGHYSRLVALLTALAGSRAEAEEAVQEAFVRALGMSGRRAVVEDPEAWLYRVAVNLLRSRWRRVLAGRRAVARLSAPDEVVTEDSGRVDDRVRLLGALRRLPFEQREAIALHYLADMPVEAVAVRVGSPIGTVKARLSRGRNALARLLGEAPVGGGSRHA
ncbi:RNA polymerase sigma24 factor [Rugosimonospora africana]|uniref:RNA polymerase sigma24 factor n=1 Tax=Rugosimonospora africana TaxID=556532 RepID=A0A8J3VPY7_9ACTN|nr:RNA polymerase sigma24 factor [Rugosimonospora africana]